MCLKHNVVEGKSLSQGLFELSHEGGKEASYSERDTP